MSELAVHGAVVDRPTLFLSLSFSFFGERLSAPSVLLRMMPTITVSQEQYEKLGQFGDRSESWETIIARLLAHVDEEAALKDEKNRAPNNTTTKESSDVVSNRGYTDPVLRKVSDGTPVRHQFKHDEYSGVTVEGVIENGGIVYDDSLPESASKAAKLANKDIKNKETEINGWGWWEYYDEESDRWRTLDDLR